MRELRKRAMQRWRCLQSCGGLAAIAADGGIAAASRAVQTKSARRAAVERSRRRSHRTAVASGRVPQLPQFPQQSLDHGELEHREEAARRLVVPRPQQPEDAIAVPEAHRGRAAGLRRLRPGHELKDRGGTADSNSFKPHSLDVDFRGTKRADAAHQVRVDPGPLLDREGVERLI